ncbi:unnamed protein product [Paramecium pentaurelia]|uniref:mRNA m(6)A methyltransferase n=2 Tax=Paramecium TaxID=5884 RepID=A0A8S1T826_9CILI|nr:unnamed protein product [Paramecium pentaurelia]
MRRRVMQQEDQLKKKSKLVIDNSDEEEICKKVKLEDPSYSEEEEEVVDVEELEESEEEEKAKKNKKQETIEDEDYIYVDKLPNSEAMLRDLKKQVEQRIKYYKMKYIQEYHENHTKQSFVHNDAIPICTDVRLMDFQKLRDEQLKIAGQLFDVIMMDPPWQLSSSQPSRGVAIAYSSLADENISKMPIETLQENGIILIWTINAKYKVTCKLIEQWGYKLIDEIIWCKKTVNGKIAKGHGFYLQHAKENCLVGVKGNINLDPKRFRQGVASDIIFSERRGQSQKPEEIYQYVEQLVPNGYYLEIFGRRNNVRKNWVTIGNEL